MSLYKPHSMRSGPSGKRTIPDGTSGDGPEFFGIVMAWAMTPDERHERSSKWL
jgi:hypothetical protein